MKILCPNCNNILERCDNTYKCKNNHSFDIAKGDYINLILANQKKSKSHSQDQKIQTESVGQ